MRSVAGSSQCRGCSRGDYVRVGGIKGCWEGIQVNGYGEEKIPQGVGIGGGSGTTAAVVWGHVKG